MICSLIVLIYFLVTLGYQSDAYALGRCPPHIPKYIRVAIIKDAESIDISLRGPHRILTLHTYEPLLEGVTLSRTKAYPTPNGITIGDFPLKVYGVKIKTQRKASIYINNRRFRGDIDIIRLRSQRLLVVNHIDVEDYLYGVLYHEISPRWPFEAIKAQAIAARTFALYRSKINQDKDYDLTSDIYSQIYGGRTSERYRTNRAVNRTRDEVLTYNGEIFPAYYHATCAGHTLDASQLWKNESFPPLKGVICNFCQNSPHFRWQKEILLDEIEAELMKAGYNVGKIRSIEPQSKNRSNRIEDLRIEGSGGEITIPAYKFRLSLGVNLIRSTNFTVSIGSRYAKFSGYGWGHGVGLCQWGAYFMAKKGYTAEEILKHYYPGAEITTFGNFLFK